MGKRYVNGVTPTAPSCVMLLREDFAASYGDSNIEGAVLAWRRLTFRMPMPWELRISWDTLELGIEYSCNIVETVSCEEISWSNILFKPNWDTIIDNVTRCNRKCTCEDAMAITCHYDELVQREKLSRMKIYPAEHVAYYFWKAPQYLLWPWCKEEQLITLLRRRGAESCTVEYTGYCPSMVLTTFDWVASAHDDFIRQDRIRSVELCPAA